MTGRAFGVGLATGSDTARVAAEAVAQAAAGVGAGATDLVVVFASPEVLEDAGVVVDEIRRRLDPGLLIGSSTEAVIAGGREIEDAPGLAVWAARLPGARLRGLRLDADAPAGMPDAFDDARGAPTILLADPFTFPVDALLADLNGRRPVPSVLGALASGGRRPGEHTLLLDDRVLVDGAVGVVLEDADVITAVSQGCAPIGPEMVITAASHGGHVEELASRPAGAKLEEVVADLDEDERRMAARGLLAGLVIDENRPDYRRGDFLVRGIHGVDAATGAIVVGERVRVGQTMRFHVRDAASAGDDLREALVAARGAGPIGGALLFACNGRGRRMFGVPDHDAATLRDELGAPAVAGMFANGELGPVGGQNFLHGFTATMALFPE